LEWDEIDRNGHPRSQEPKEQTISRNGVMIPSRHSKGYAWYHAQVGCLSRELAVYPAILSMQCITDGQKIHHGILHRISILPPEKLINLSLSIGLVHHWFTPITHSYMTSTQQSTPPTIHRSSLSTCTIIYTLAAVTLAIIALFIPSLLRGRSLRQFPTLGLGSRYHSIPTSTMSEVKLTPRELKEWNV
jgi:hypothetical protein